MTEVKPTAFIGSERQGELPPDPGVTAADGREALLTQQAVPSQGGAQPGQGRRQGSCAGMQGSYRSRSRRGGPRKHGGFSIPAYSAPS